MTRTSTTQPLEQLHDDLFCATHDVWDGPLHVPLRTTVVRVHGGLVLHSPGPITDALAGALERCGTVAHVIAPSRAHYLFAAAAMERYPGATFWAAPGLREKVDTLPAGPVLGDERPPWAEELEPHLLRGNERMRETVFVHYPSRSLICCDFFFNVSAEPSWLSRLAFRMLGVMGKPGMSRFFRFMSKDKRAMADSVAPLLELELNRIVVAHGDILEEGCAAQLRSATRWLFESPRRQDL
jgi:hypothetical protein